MVNQDTNSNVKRNSQVFFLGTNSLLQVKNYRLTRWIEIKETELKKYEIDYRALSRATTLFVLSGHSEFHWMDEKKLYWKYADKVGN